VNENEMQIHSYTVKEAAYTNLSNLFCATILDFRRIRCRERKFKTNKKINIYLPKVILLIVWLNWIIECQQQRHWLI